MYRTWYEYDLPYCGNANERGVGTLVRVFTVRSFPIFASPGCKANMDSLLIG